MSKEIKQLNKSYLNKLVRLNGLAYNSSSKGVRDYFKFTFKKGKIFGYFLDNKLIGCVGIAIFKKMHYAEIEHLLVHPKFQRKGIAKELMKFIENYSKNKLKIKDLRLNVRVKNKKAFNFYKKLKFKEHAYIMVKVLK